MAKKKRKSKSLLPKRIAGVKVPKAVRKGVIAMSAATDEIIEKMKTLTVSTQTLYRPNVGVPSG